MTKGIGFIYVVRDSVGTDATFALFPEGFQRIQLRRCDGQPSDFTGEWVWLAFGCLVRCGVILDRGRAHYAILSNSFGSVGGRLETSPLPNGLCFTHIPEPHWIPGGKVDIRADCSARALTRKWVSFPRKRESIDPHSPGFRVKHGMAAWERP